MEFDKTTAYLKHLLLCLCFAISCTPITITADHLRIVKTNQHPFLVDHQKMLQVVNDQQIVAETQGYIDAGMGCNTHLFEAEDHFILIECNGTVFHVYKKGRHIVRKGWTWRQKLPPNYVGVFERQRGQEAYLLTQRPRPTLEAVYVFKDPDG